MINNTIFEELSMIGAVSKDLFEKMIMETLINTIKKRGVFSHDLLNLAWSVTSRDGKDPLQSELWLAMKDQCMKIIENGNGKDWWWLQNVLLPSTVSSVYLLFVFLYKA